MSSIDDATQNALAQAKSALDERARIREAIAAAEAELATAKAELPKIRTEFARERVAAIVGSKSNRTAKAHAGVAAARERIEELQDEVDGLQLALVEQEDVLLAAEEQLSAKAATLREAISKKYVLRYRDAFKAFQDVLEEGLSLMVTFDISLPALRATQVFEDPLGMRMLNLGALSASGTYSGPRVSPEMATEFGLLRRTLDAAAREARRIHERRQVQEIREQRERDERGEGRRSTFHYLPADAEVA